LELAERLEIDLTLAADVVRHAIIDARKSEDVAK
jgi:hypothetical protein